MNTSFYIDFAQPIHLPPYWLNHPQVVTRYDKSDIPQMAKALNRPYGCPLMMHWKYEKDWFEFDIEPVISVSCKNNIVKRSVLKAGLSDIERRGTVKELWSQDDYEITISGIFISNGKGLPENDIRRLRAYCEGRESVEVSSPLLNLFNIRYITIEDYQFPFTKGVENQMFIIKATSDDFDRRQLLITE